jgi:hypothetical protein
MAHTVTMGSGETLGGAQECTAAIGEGSRWRRKRSDEPRDLRDGRGGGGVEGSHHEASLGAGLGREDPGHPDHVRPHRAMALQGYHRRIPIANEHPGLKQHEPRIRGIKASLRVRAIELLPTF